MNYTPGPWTVAARVVSKRPATVVLDADKNEVCEVYACSALIAAAPDLLAAVHGLLASCGPQHESETAEMYQERMTLLQWHIDRASEALTKATGE